jgi:hypothetical protein
MGGAVNTTPQSLYPHEDPRLPVVEEAGWAPGLLWTDMQNRKSFNTSGFEPWTIQLVASRYTDYFNPPPPPVPNQCVSVFAEAIVFLCKFLLSSVETRGLRCDTQCNWTENAVLGRMAVTRVF